MKQRSEILSMASQLEPEYSFCESVSIEAQRLFNDDYIEISEQNIVWEYLDNEHTPLDHDDFTLLLTEARNHGHLIQRVVFYAVCWSLACKRIDK